MTVGAVDLGRGQAALTRPTGEGAVLLAPFFADFFGAVEQA